MGSFDMAVVCGGCCSKRGDLAVRTANRPLSAGAEPSGQDQLVGNLLIQTNSIQKLHHNKPWHKAEPTQPRFLFFQKQICGRLTGPEPEFWGVSVSRWAPAAAQHTKFLTS